MCCHGLGTGVGLENVCVMVEGKTGEMRPLCSLIGADYTNLRGFPDSSVGKESTCNTGDPSLIPGLGRSAGEGIGYPLQYSWASQWLSW